MQHRTGAARSNCERHMIGKGSCHAEMPAPSGRQPLRRRAKGYRSFMVLREMS